MKKIILNSEKKENNIEYRKKKTILNSDNVLQKKTLQNKLNTEYKRKQ
jgi:hypothetical protein